MRPLVAHGRDATPVGLRARLGRGGTTRQEKEEPPAPSSGYAGGPNERITMKTSEVLNRAADLIEERGWTQGPHSMDVTSVPLCTESAIAVASGRATCDGGFGERMIYHYGGSIGCPASAAVADYVETDPWFFNDQPGRTAAEVLEVLRACAVIEAAREEQDAAWETYAELVSA